MTLKKYYSQDSVTNSCMQLLINTQPKKFVLINQDITLI